jgi:hypothetical protein
MKRFISTLFLFISLMTGLFAQQTTQTVKGRVIDEAAKYPVAGATVVLIQPEGQPLIGTSTDPDGYFSLKNVPIGRQTIKISFVGYNEQLIPNLIVTAGKEVVLNIALIEMVNALDEVVVSYDRSQDEKVTNNEMATLSARPFNLEDTKRYAGALGDPARMAANFAGVVSGNDSRNDIVVRGNSPTGMLWQFEGLNIPNPNHFGAFGTTGGPVSILNNNVLAKSDFMTSAFPAQYGNATAGVFDLKMRNGNSDKHEFLGQIGFNGFEFGAEGGLAKNSKASYLVNYRYSTLSLFQNIGVDFGTGSATPNYQDLNFKVFVPTGSKGRLSVFGMGGVSDVDFLGNDVDTTETNLYANENENVIVDFKMGVVGASYEYNISPKTFFKITTGVSGTEQQFRGDSISVVTREEFLSGKAKFTTQKYSSVFSITHKFNPKNTLVIGAMTDLMEFNLKDSEFSNEGTLERELVNIKDNSLLTQAYMQWKHRFNDRMTLNTGLHFQHYNLNNQAVIEPRLGLKYLLNSNSSLSIGYGLHSQTPSTYTSYVITSTPQSQEFTNKDVGFTRSHHVVLGYERQVNETTSLKIETYYQSIFDAPVTNHPSSFSALNSGASFAPLEEDSLVNKGKGFNYGVELTLERNFNKGFYYLFTTSLFDSRYEGSDGIERNTAFNTHYVVNALAGKEWKVGKTKNNVLVLNIKVSTVGGRYFSPLDENASSLEGEAVYDETKAYSLRQTPYFRTDIKLAYRKEMKKSTLETGVDLQNVTNNQNIFQQQYNRRTNQIVNEYQQGFFPVPFVRYTF